MVIGRWVYPIFKKYNLDELKKYQRLVIEEFNYLNPKVREVLDTGKEHYNLMLAV